MRVWEWLTRIVFHRKPSEDWKQSGRSNRTSFPKGISDYPCTTFLFSGDTSLISRITWNFPWQGYLPAINALIIRDSRWVSMQVVLHWYKNIVAAMIIQTFFRVWLKWEVTRKNMAGGFTSANLKAGDLQQNRTGAPSPWNEVRAKKSLKRYWT